MTRRNSACQRFSLLVPALMLVSVVSGCITSVRTETITLGLAVSKETTWKKCQGGEGGYWAKSHTKPDGTHSNYWVLGGKNTAYIEGHVSELPLHPSAKRAVEYIRSERKWAIEVSEDKDISLDFVRCDMCVTISVACKAEAGDVSVKLTVVGPPGSKYTFFTAGKKYVETIPSSGKLVASISIGEEQEWVYATCVKKDGVKVMYKKLNIYDGEAVDITKQDFDEGVKKQMGGK